MSGLSWVALTFGLACGLAPLAQAARIRVKRSSEDVSLVWLVLYGCGATVWLAYGAVHASLPLIVSQAVALSSVTVTFFLAIRARKRQRRRYLSSIERAGQRPAEPNLRAAQNSARRARARLQGTGRPRPR